MLCVWENKFRRVTRIHNGGKNGSREEKSDDATEKVKQRSDAWDSGGD